MVIIHGSDMRSPALLGGKVPVGVKSTVGSSIVDAAIFCRDGPSRTHIFDGRIIRDDDFKWLDVLGTQTSQPTLKRFWPITRYQRNAEFNVRFHHPWGVLFQAW